jgi:hypothetical protein
MSLDERLRQGLEGLDALEVAPPEGVVAAVLGQGRRSRWTRRIVAGALALVAAMAAVVVAPKALDALRSTGERRPAVPSGGMGTIATVAGTGAAGLWGDGGRATASQMNYPVDLAFDGDGNLYILELGHEDRGFGVRVRKVDRAGRITTVAGPGGPGAAGDLILGRTFGSTGLAVDDVGNIYIGGGDGPDVLNRVIRVEPSGQVTTVAGTGEPGSSGDGGPATAAEVQDVWDVAVDRTGTLYIAGNNRIRKVDTNGVITTIVGGARKGFSGDNGPATEAQINRVTGMAVDDPGNVYFIDYRNGRIRRIDTDGIITTIGGPGRKGRSECFFGEGVPARQAMFCGPEHLAVDAEGNLFIADTYNNRIRMIDTNGVIHTIAGSGDHAYSGDGGPALDAALAEPSGVAVGPDGAVYIADSGNDRVRRVVL